MVTQDRECVISATFPAFLAILVPVRAILSDASIPLVLPTGGCLAFGSPEGSHSGKAQYLCRDNLLRGFVLLYDFEGFV